MTTKKKYVKLHKEYIDFDGPIEPIISQLQAIYDEHQDAYIDSESGYYDSYTDYVYWEVPMTPEEIEKQKKLERKAREEAKRKKAKDDQQRKKTLQKLYKEHFGKDLELE